jgi:hypothetical protein
VWYIAKRVAIRVRAPSGDNRWDTVARTPVDASPLVGPHFQNVEPRKVGHEHLRLIEIDCGKV